MYHSTTAPTIDISYEHIIMLFFNLFVLLSSLMGDTTILVGIIRYNAIKLNKAVVAIILHLAVNDLMQTMFVVLPQTISIALGSEQWVLGEAVCDLFDSVWLVSNIATPLLTCLLSTTKMLTIRSCSCSKHVLGLIGQRTLSARSAGQSLCYNLL